MVDLIQFAPEGEVSLLVQLVQIMIPIILSALPVWIALKLLGARNVGIIRVFVVNIIVAFLAAILNHYLSIVGTVISFILLLFIYKVVFRIGWIRAVLVWILQFVILAILVFILALFGISLL